MLHDTNKLRQILHTTTHDKHTETWQNLKSTHITEYGGDNCVQYCSGQNLTHTRIKTCVYHQQILPKTLVGRTIRAVPWRATFRVFLRSLHPPKETNCPEGIHSSEIRLSDLAKTTTTSNSCLHSWSLLRRHSIPCFKHGPQSLLQREQLKETRWYSSHNQGPNSRRYRRITTWESCSYWIPHDPHCQQESSGTKDKKRSRRDLFSPPGKTSQKRTESCLCKITVII